MDLQIMNPNYAAPVEAKSAALKAKLAAWFAANPSVQTISEEDIRATFAEAAGLSQGQIQAVARGAGATVIYRV